MVVTILPQLGAAFLFTRKSRDVETRLFEPDFTKIRCPLCQWRPQKPDRWFCEPGCLHRWNTFDTAGICPKCGKHWQDTACLKCGQWSPHADWYEHEER